MTDDEQRTLTALTGEGLRPYGWGNEPGARYGEHRHPYDKVLVCVSGSIVFHTPDGNVAVGPGDRMELPAGTPHSATVGPLGVRCVEAPRPAR